MRGVRDAVVGELALPHMISFYISSSKSFLMILSSPFWEKRFFLCAQNPTGPSVLRGHRVGGGWWRARRKPASDRVHGASPGGGSL